MHLTAHNDIAIAQIILFIPVLISGFVICLRHGFSRRNGWIFLITFAVIRITGASLDLATISNPKIGLLIAAAVLSSTGPSVMLLVSICLIGRMVIPRRFDRVLILLLIIIVPLGAYGGAESGINYADNGVYQVKTESKIAAILYVAVFIGIVALVALNTLHQNTLNHDNKRVFTGLSLTLPLILVRLIFSILSVFEKANDGFNALHPEIYTYLFMSVLPEVVIIYIYVCLGLLIQPSKKKIEHRDPMDPAELEHVHVRADK